MSEKLLIIPDTHQDIFFIDQILRQEKDFDRIVHLGDWFDSFLSSPKVSGVKDVAEFMIQFGKDYDVTFLVGNHDLSYYEDLWPYLPRWGLREKYFWCSGYTKSKSDKIKKVLTPEFAKNCRLAVIEQGFVLSHAGFHPALTGNLTPEEIVAKVNNAWERFPLGVVDGDTWIYQAGEARRGDGIGGPLWLDCFWEFQDTPFRQICGHTNNPSPRKEGGSYMLDAGQTCYGILQNGELIIRDAYDGQDIACKKTVQDQIKALFT